MNFRTLALATLVTVACTGAIASTTTTIAPVAQSMHLSETPDAYKVTLIGADPSKLQVNFKDGTLHITSGDARYEQSFDLPAADLARPLSVNPDKGTIVISVPKTSENLSASSSNTAPAATINPVTVTPLPPASRSPQQAGSIQSQMLKQLAAMQRQMNAMMNSSMADDDDSFDPLSTLAALAHGTGMGGIGGNAITVQDNGSDYIIRAQHVDDGTKLHVAVDNGNVLKITTTTQTSSKASQAQSYQSSNSTQMMTLPSAVQSDKMTTRREGDSIIVTLPKA